MNQKNSKVEIHECSKQPWSVEVEEHVAVYFIGSLRINNYEESNPEKAAKLVCEFARKSRIEFIEWCRCLDGNFVIIVETPSYILAVVDLVRSIPLYYREVGASIEFATRANLLTQEPFLISETAVAEICAAGFTSADCTIFQDVKSVSAGSALIISDASSELVPLNFFVPSFDQFGSMSSSSYQQRLTDVFDEVFSNLKASLHGRQACVPVSAGLDSRLVLSGLLKYGHQNILAYSYGLKKNSDAAAAEAICKQLQVKWVFIEMTPALIRKFSKSKVYRDYCKFAFTGDSIPFIQDLYAVDFLLNTVKLVDSDSVFINGNSGDFISGGHIPSALHRLDHIPSGVSEIQFAADEYIKKHFALWEYAKDKKIWENFQEKITSKLESLLCSSPNLPVACAYEALELIDRQSKFVVSGQRVYDFFGLKWRLPLWEKPFYDFFKNLPIEYKIDQKLYRETLINNNWAGIWKNIPINQKQIRPLHVRIFRFFAKCCFVFLGKKIWAKFDKMFFAYWIDNLCSYSYFPYHMSIIHIGRNRNAVAVRAKLFANDLSKIGCSRDNEQ